MCQSVVQNVWNEPVRSIIIRHVKVASFLCLYFEPVSRLKTKTKTKTVLNKNCSVLCLYTPVSASLPEIECMYAAGEHPRGGGRG